MCEEGCLRVPFFYACMFNSAKDYPFSVNLL